MYKQQYGFIYDSESGKTNKKWSQIGYGALPIKTLGSLGKIRVGRVTGNTHIFFFWPYKQCFEERAGHIFSVPQVYQFYLIQVNKISFVEMSKKCGILDLLCKNKMFFLFCPKDRLQVPQDCLILLSLYFQSLRSCKSFTCKQASRQNNCEDSCHKCEVLRYKLMQKFMSLI